MASKEYHKHYYQEHKEERSVKDRKYRQEHKEQIKWSWRRCLQKLRCEILTHYSDGKPQCAICGNPDPLVLCIDHIEGGGNAHKKAIGKGGMGFYHWLRQQNYPTGFQVLCQNCNIRKYRLEEIAKNMEAK